MQTPHQFKQTHKNIWKHIKRRGCTLCLEAFSPTSPGCGVYLIFHQFDKMKGTHALTSPPTLGKILYDLIMYIKVWRRITLWILNIYLLVSCPRISICIFTSPTLYPEQKLCLGLENDWRLEVFHSLHFNYFFWRGLLPDLFLVYLRTFLSYLQFTQVFHFCVAWNQLSIRSLAKPIRSQLRHGITSSFVWQFDLIRVILGLGGRPWVLTSTTVFISNSRVLRPLSLLQ